MEKILVMSFKKDNGKNYNFNVSFPKDNVRGDDVRSLANTIIAKEIIQTKDNAKIVQFEKAYYKQVVVEEVSIG